MSATAQAHRAPATRSAWRKTGDALGTLAAVLVVVVACFVLVIVIATRFAQKQEFTAFGHPVLVVLSGSMSPVIDTGDLIIDSGVSPAQASHLRVGQIITFADSAGSKKIITHRIHRVVRENGRVLYETKGDANNAPDSSLRPASDVIGTYVTKVPRGGYFLVNLHRPLVLGLLLLAPMLWFVGEPLRRLAREEDEPTGDPSDSDGTGKRETP
jgi:signal peptidase